MKNSLCLVILLLAAACSGSPKTSTTEQPEGSEVTEPGDDFDAGPPPASYGEDCGRYGLCAEGLECLEYYGIAGGNVPAFHTCEQRCDGKEGCPEGLTCATIADGPGAVCRP